MHKHKFAAFVQKTNPLPYVTVAIKRKKVKGKVLPHGLYVGQRVYYVARWRNPLTRGWGTVIDDPRQTSNKVWCLWDTTMEDGSPTYGGVAHERKDKLHTIDPHGMGNNDPNS